MYSVAYAVLLVASGIFGSSAFAAQTQLPIPPETLRSFRERIGEVYSNVPISPDEFSQQYERTTADFMTKKGREEYLVVQSPIFQKPSTISSIEQSFSQRPLAVVNDTDLPDVLRRYRNISHVAILDAFLTGEAAHHLFFGTYLSFQDARPQSSAWKIHLVAPYHLDPPYRIWEQHARYAAVADHKNAIDLSLDGSIEQYFASQIGEIREKYRWRIESVTSPFYSWIKENAEGKKPNGAYFLDPSRVKVKSKGVYLWTDKRGEPIAVIKPMKKAAPICFEKRKSVLRLEASHQEENSCLSMVREGVASEFAKQIGTWQVVPETVLAILESSVFSLLQDGSDSTKLCSVQKFVPDSKPLDYDIPLDPRDCEEINLFYWVSGDWDMHSRNLLVQPGGRIKKADNDQAFPVKNRISSNYLVFHSSMNQPLSDRGRAKIETLPVEALSELLKQYGLEDAIPAMKERIDFLKEIAQPGISLKEINARFDRRFL